MSIHTKVVTLKFHEKDIRRALLIDVEKEITGINEAGFEKQGWHCWHPNGSTLITPADYFTSEGNISFSDGVLYEQPLAILQEKNGTLFNHYIRKATEKGLDPQTTLLYELFADTLIGKYFPRNPGNLLHLISLLAYDYQKVNELCTLDPALLKYALHYFKSSTNKETAQQLKGFFSIMNESPLKKEMLTFFEKQKILIEKVPA